MNKASLTKKAEMGIIKADTEATVLNGWLRNWFNNRLHSCRRGGYFTLSVKARRNSTIRKNIRMYCFIGTTSFWSAVEICDFGNSTHAIAVRKFERKRRMCGNSEPPGVGQPSRTPIICLHQLYPNRLDLSSALTGALDLRFRGL